MDIKKKLAELLEEAPYNIYGDRLGNWCFKSGLEIAAEYLIARGVTLQTPEFEMDKEVPMNELKEILCDG